MLFFSDLHIHTTASQCCNCPEQTPEVIIPLLVGKGYRKIGFTDHVWVSDGIEPNDFYRFQDGSKQLELLNHIRSREWGIKVLVGCEADMIAPGKFGITPEFKKRMDYILMSASHFHMRGFVQAPSENTPRALARHMLEFFISAVASGIPDVIAHPFFPCGYVELYDRAIAGLTDTELLDALAVAAENKIGIEINRCFLPKPSPGRCFSLETPARVLTLAKKAGCTFTMGSDSHAIESFPALDKLQVFAESLGLTAADIHPLAKA